MNEQTLNYLRSVLHELRKLPSETEWVEFKRNKAEPQDIGEYISALSNSAALLEKANAWMVWGIEDDSHDVVGTSFSPSTTKVGNEELENWLLKLLTPKLDFRFHSLMADDKPIILLEIGAAFRHPTQFQGTEFIRVGSYKKKLKDFQEKERQLWRRFDKITFEQEIAASDVPSNDVLRLLDYPAYFELLELPLPEGRDGILETFQNERMIVSTSRGRWNVTNLGAVLFAKKLGDFSALKRKAVRVVLYKNDDRTETVREQVGGKGYACGFEGLIGYVTNLLPSNEVIGKALRETVPMFPELAIRELVANAIIHQDFHATGTSPMVEIFNNRIEITNAGIPLVKTDRFLDSPPRSRNELLASFLRRVGVCEERGTGIDKVVSLTEMYQLPAPLFEISGEHTRVVLFSHRKFNDMDKFDRIRACYLHAVLKFVKRDCMTNASLRERFGIESKNSAIASRIIKDTVEEGFVKLQDKNASKKYTRYIPWWA